MIYVTPVQVIAWLETFPAETRFSWMNKEGAGCLFTRYFRANSKFPNALCELEGHVTAEDQSGSPYIGRIRFHDAFWSGLAKGGVSAEEAIKHLKEINANYTYSRTPALG